jgi:hypothetical protein
MSDQEEEIDYTNVDWTPINEEMEALEFIFPDEIKMI